MTRFNQPQNIRDRSFRFACAIVDFYAGEAQRSDTGRTLGRQLLRSGTSIGANLEEAEAGQSRADFIAKCSIALKEARETHYWLRLFNETKIAPAESLRPLIQESHELIAILTTIIKRSRAA